MVDSDGRDGEGVGGWFWWAWLEYEGLGGGMRRALMFNMVSGEDLKSVAVWGIGGGGG